MASSEALASKAPAGRSLGGLLVLLGSLGCHAQASIPPGAAKRWEAMNANERHAHMTAVVLPQMRAVFQAHDPDRFAAFDCETCHGVGAADGTYAMPNPDLVQFPARGFRKEIYKPHREMVRFMWSEVQPKMAALLGVEESRYGPGPGFNCRNCHVRRED